MDAPPTGEADPTDVDTCTWCGRPLDTVAAVQLALLREWSAGGQDAPWGEPWGGVEDDADDDYWRVRCVRAFCDVDHAREWLADGHPTDAEWSRDKPHDEWSDTGCCLGAIAGMVVVLVILALAALGAREAWRILT